MRFIMKQTWIIKIGSNLLTTGGSAINKDIITALTAQIAMLQQKQIAVILVSSGAIAAGLGVSNLSSRPTNIHQLQALASIGQMDLMHTYENAFATKDILSAQVLLTHEDLRNKERYDNIAGTLGMLLDWGVVPIVNENDTVATDEIRFGDNDNLAALLSNLIKADKLVILTDQEGVFDKNPTQFSDATLISTIDKFDANLDNFATSEGSGVGTGGMKSKILAARVAKCAVHIVSGKNPHSILDILYNKSTGTLLL